MKPAQPSHSSLSPAQFEKLTELYNAAFPITSAIVDMQTFGPEAVLNGTFATLRQVLEFQIARLANSIDDLCKMNIVNAAQIDVTMDILRLAKQDTRC